MSNNRRSGYPYPDKYLNDDKYYFLQISVGVRAPRPTKEPQ